MSNSVTNEKLLKKKNDFNLAWAGVNVCSAKVVFKDGSSVGFSDGDDLKDFNTCVDTRINDIKEIQVYTFEHKK